MLNYKLSIINYKFFRLLVLLFIAGSASGAESDLLYTSAINMVRLERETEARELFERCLAVETDNAELSQFDRLNVEHWLYYLRNRSLNFGEYQREFNFTPVDRAVLRPYYPALDSMNVAYNSGDHALAAALLDKVYTRACADPLIPSAYRLYLLLWLDNVENTGRLPRSALPRLDRYVSDDTDNTELGLELAGALYGGYGSDVFSHISPEIFASVGFSAITSSLLSGRTEEAFNLYNGFLYIITDKYGDDSAEALELMPVESLIIAITLPDDRKQEFYESYIGRMDNAIEKCLDSKPDKERLVYLAQLLLSLNKLRLKISADSETFDKGEKKALDFIKAHGIADDDRLCLSLSNYYQNSNPGLSRRYAEKALKSAEKAKTGGERLRKAAMQLYSQALNEGDFDTALDYRVRSAGKADKAVVDSLTACFYNEAALKLLNKSDNAGLLTVCRRALDHEERTKGRNTANYAQLLALTVRALMDCNLYSEARTELYRLSDLCDSNGLNIYNYIDKFDVTERIYRQLGLPYDGVDELVADIPAIEKAHGKYSGQYRTALSNLAEEYISRKDYTNGIATYKQYIAVDSVARGYLYDSTPADMTLRFYRHLAEPTDSSARCNLARLEAIIPIYLTDDEYAGSIHAQRVLFAASYYISYYASFLEDYRKYYDNAARRKEWLSESSAAYLNCLGDMLWGASMLGDNDLTYSVMPEYIAVSRALFTPQLVLMTDEERSAYWPQKAEKLNRRILFPLFRGGGDRFAAFAYDNALLNKGLLLQSTRAIDKALDNEAELKAELYRIVEQQKTEESPDIRKRLYLREKEILAGISERTDWGDFLSLNWRHVEAALPDTAIAVEFCTINSDNSARYGALVLAPGDEPRFIDLFRINSLQQADDKYRFIADSIWTPIMQRFPEAGTIYFSPVGELCRLPLEAAAPDGHTIFRLSSTRRLALPHTGHAIAKGVAMGGLQYDMDSTAMTADTRRHNNVSLPKRSVRHYFSSANSALEYLPGTEREALAVADIAKKARLTFHVYTGTEGTEASFKALSGSDTDIIHIATHGFYWTEEEAEYMPRLDRIFSEFKSTEDRSLSRSGLMLAGADRAYRGMDIDDDTDDGILTAREIADLDLSATDFVILSACNTGLGDVSGEGVFGLQRGFKKAGVNTLMLSLWKVSDEATAMLMDEFYRSFFAGHTKAESLHLAQQRLRTYTAPDGTRPFSNPDYWAPFILLDAEF